MLLASNKGLMLFFVDLWLVMLFERKAEVYVVHLKTCMYNWHVFTNFQHKKITSVLFKISASDLFLRYS